MARRAVGRAPARPRARAHARSGDRIAIASYLGSSRLETAIPEFAEAYADQNERDYRALITAMKAGRVLAQEGL
jgi:thiamine monophosphate kinase